MEEVELKYTHSGDTLRTPLNTNLNNNERQDCGEVLVGGKVNGD
jgi:hypothetical protein